MSGAFLLVLHSHLPYVRGAGRWPHGEEWVHEAILETYLPLLVLLHDLRAEGVPYRITVGLTPTLLEQLAHPEIRRRALAYVDDLMIRAERDAGDAGDAGTRALAARYRDELAATRAAYIDRFAGDIPGAFADLARSGHVELLTSAATHGYLPLLDETSVRRQVALGAAATGRITGVAPRGIWLPECAYRPGLEEVLAGCGLTHFLLDAPLLPLDGSPDAVVRPSIRPATSSSASALAETGDPIAPWSPHDRAYRVGRSEVAVFARDPALAGQVWSARQGYPGDGVYREFHRRDARSGLRYWRVTGDGVALGDKAAYDPDAAAGRAAEHAWHYARLVQGALSAAEDRSGEGAAVAVAFDSELFGHWWHEGVVWLGHLLRALAPVTATLADQLAGSPPLATVRPREGSWGRANDHSTWLDPRTAWMWERLRAMAASLETLRSIDPGDRGVRGRALRQAARELLLAQSSDWPFLVTTGQAVDYAISRFRAHSERFERLVGMARSGADDGTLASVERADDVFPDVARVLAG